MIMNRVSVLKGLLQHDIGGGKTQLWPFMVAAMLAFAWLQPHHYYPWPAFHTNAFVATWMLVAMLVLFAMGIRPKEWPPLATAFLVLVLGVLLQFYAGLIVHVADAAVTSMQLLGCALIVIVVRALYLRHGVEKLGDVIFSAMVIAGMASVAGALYQVFRIVPQDQLAGLGIWIMAIPDGVRPAGNVAQPNEMATLLVWATIGGLWAVYRGVIRWSVFALLGCYLALGLGISQSRVGLMEMLVLIGILAIKRDRVGGWAASTALAWAVLVQLAVFFSLPVLTETLLLDYDGRALSQLVSNTARLDIYQHVLYAISQKPWFGYGMTTLAPAQWATADELAGLYSYFHASHNLLLDLFAWWGIPIGAICIGFLIWWGRSVAKAMHSAPQHLFGCALAVFIIHSMVELPHWSAAYLFPATLFAAALDCSVKWKRILSVRPSIHILALTLAVTMLAVVIFDYVRLEKNYAHLRAEERRLVQVADVPNAVVLTHLADYLRMGRIIARPNVSGETIAWMEQTVHGIPNYNTQVTHAVTLALNGRKPEALKWMRRLNSVSPKHYHADYLRVWSYFQSQHPHLIGDMQWPPLEQSN